MFAQLVTELSTSTKTNDKLQSLVDYFAIAPDSDKVWVIAIFSGRRPQAYGEFQADAGMVCRNYQAILHGCLMNVIILLATWRKHLHYCYRKRKQISRLIKVFPIIWKHLFRLKNKMNLLRKKFIIDSWNQMNRDERFVFNKLITGSFRIGVSQKTIVNALAKTVDLPASVIAHRISGNWDPVTTTFDELLSDQHQYQIFQNHILFIWPMHWKITPETFRRSYQNGRLNGNGMAFAGKL